MVTQGAACPSQIARSSEAARRRQIVDAAIETIAEAGLSNASFRFASYLAAHPDRVDRVVVSSPNSIWAPAYTDATRLNEGGRADQQAVIGRHTRFILPHILLGMIGVQGTYALLPDDNIDGASRPW